MIGAVFAPVVLSTMNDVINQIGSAFDLLFGSDLLVGMLVFIFFMVLTLLLGLGLLVGSVIIIPGMYVVFKWIPDIKIFVALFLGMFVGLALHRLMRR